MSPVVMGEIVSGGTKDEEVTVPVLKALVIVSLCQFSRGLFREL